MPEGHETEPDADETIVAYSGIYNADGGLLGEARYVLGHLLGTVECALCDITHSAVRRKPEWDRMVARIGMPVVLLHRNELDERLETAIRGMRLPVVLAHRANGSTGVALTAEQLAQLNGSVDGFAGALEGTPGIQPGRARIG